MIYNSEFIINTKRLKENFNRIKNNINPKTKIIPMLKGDAYGHGLLKVAELLEDDIEFVGVAQVKEGVDLRKNGFKKRIIIFAGIVPEQIDTVIEYNLEPIIHSFLSLDALKEAFKKRNITDYPVHLKINTGLNRLGFNLDELELLTMLFKDMKEFNVVSTYSHFIEGFKPRSKTTHKQFSKFKKALNILYEFGFEPGFTHICDSGSYEWFGGAHLDAVRIGRALYMDNPLLDEAFRFKDVGSWHAKLTAFSHVHKNETIGYDINNTAKKFTTLGIINVGYGDGLISQLKDVKASVMINGEKYSIISIAMDQSYIILDDSKTRIGDTVVIFGEDDNGNYMSSNRVMGLLDDEGCTLTTLLSNRVKKTYI